VEVRKVWELERIPELASCLREVGGALASLATTNGVTQAVREVRSREGR
jgi:hypothetical protein